MARKSLALDFPSDVAPLKGKEAWRFFGPWTTMAVITVISGFHM